MSLLFATTLFVRPPFFEINNSRGVYRIRRVTQILATRITFRVSALRQA
jgi:hypothetical protein